MELARRRLLRAACLSAVVVTVGYRTGDPRATAVAFQSAEAPHTAASVLDVRASPFGAMGNGVADDTSAIQRAIDAASGKGGAVYFPPGSYRVTRELTVRAPNVSLVGAGAGLSTLLITASAEVGVTFDISRLAPRVAMTSDLGIGMRTLSVTKGAGKTFRPGSWLFLEDRSVYDGTFLTHVAVVSGDEVTLEEASPVAINSATGGAAYTYDDPPLLEGTTIRDLGFESADGPSARHEALLMLSRTHRAVVENCRFAKSTGPLLTLRDSRGAMVRRSIFEEAMSVGGSGVEGQQCTACSVSDCEFRLCPFGVVFSQSPHADVAHNVIGGRGKDEVRGRGIKVQNGSGFSRIVNNTISDTGLFGIYSSDSWDVLISGNTILGAGTDPLEHGIQVGGYLDSASARNIVSNNVLSHIAGDGVAVNPTNGRDKELFNIVTANQIQVVGGSGIQFVASRNIAAANAIHRYKTSAVRADPGTSGNIVIGNVGGADDLAGATVDIGGIGQHELLQLHAAGNTFRTSEADTRAGLALFPGTAKYPPSARFTLYVLLQTESGSGEYSLRNPAGQPIGSPVSTTGREPTVVSASLPAMQLPSSPSFFEERLGARGGTAMISSAFILVEW